MANGAALPQDWQPTNEQRDYGRRVLHLTEAQIDEAAEDMRLWAEANANRQIARKASWGAAFKGWMRRQAKQQGERNGKRSGSLLDAIDNLPGDEGYQGAVNQDASEGSFFGLPTRQLR